MTEQENIKIENERLFEHEFYPNASALYNFAFHLSYNEDDANDLVQDTFLKSFRFINSYEKGTNAKAWLFKILKNNFINEYRKQKKSPYIIDYEDYIAYQDSDEATGIGSLDMRTSEFQNQMGDEITVALNDLPPEFRMIILLCDVEDFTYEELAKIFDIPVGTVRSRLHRGRNMLKEKLIDYAKSKGIK